MTMSRHTAKKLFGLAVIASLSVMAMTLMGTDSAMAQTAKNFSKVQSNIATQVVYVPRLIATIAYVIAAFFAATGLLRLKDWIHDPDKNPLNGALFRLIVSSMLIVFPHVLVIANSTFFGKDSSGDTQKVNIDVPMQSLDGNFTKAK